MNQCSRNCRRHAAMLLGQLVQRSNRGRIAQHHGDLATTGDAGSLTLGAGLGPHSVRRCGREDFTAIRGEHGTRLGFADVERAAVSGDVAPACGSLFNGASDDRSGKAGRVELRANVHGLFQSGPIPPMSESYSVTSDVSIGICA